MGILTDKNSLPVKSLSYGGAYEYSRLKYILGPLICNGKAKPYPSEEAALEQEKLQNQFSAISKLIETNKSNVDLVKTELKNEIKHQATVTQKKVNDQFAEVSEQIEEIKTNADSAKMAVEKEKVQNQLTTMSAKLNEIGDRKEPVIAFRATN